MIIPLGNKVRAEVVDSVLGQLSDGIWENSNGMNKYWMFAHTKGTDLEISEDYSKRYGSSRTIWNGFDGKSEKEIKDWFANKAKQVVKIWAEDYHKDPKAVWDRNNTDVVAYMGGHDVPDVTVADVYECYDFLKGRSGKKYGTTPAEEPAEEVIDEPYEVVDEVVEPKVSGGMNPSQQDVEDFFLDASTKTEGKSIKASRRTFTKHPSSYVKASEAYDELERFEIEFENIQREWYNTEFYKNTRINLFTYAEGKYPNSIRRAGVNWGAWGTQPPTDTKEFAEALLAAAELCETLNNKFPNVKDF